MDDEKNLDFFQNPCQDITRQQGSDPIDQQSKRSLRKFVKNIARNISTITNKKSAQEECVPKCSNSGLFGRQDGQVQVFQESL